MHPTSLPSGHIDIDAERFLDLMQALKLHVWQMLPLGIPDHTGSPYQSCSAFACDPGLLPKDLNAAPDPAGLRRFREQEAHWIEDFARFMVLRRHFDGAAWHAWPAAYRDRNPDALGEFARQHASAISAEIAQQYALEQRWQSLRAKAADRGIRLFGDMPIFVALDSADVWANRDQFLLDDEGKPTLVAGVPPDYFSETGQRWGNPHYDWDRMQQDNFSWWHARMRRQLNWFDMVRLDHFRGLEASWMIPAEAETAIDGYWQKVPGQALLESLHEEFEDLPIVAEDLGVITPEVEALRQQFSLPGMAVLQFSFDHFDDNPHKPKNIGPDRVVYTGTHDNDTTLGWYRSLDENMQHQVREVLHGGPAEEVLEKMIASALATQGALAVLPLQDLLGLGAEARMNIPGEVGRNWQWRFSWEQVERASQLLANFSAAVAANERDHAC